MHKNMCIYKILARWLLIIFLWSVNSVVIAYFVNYVNYFKLMLVYWNSVYMRSANLLDVLLLAVSVHYFEPLFNLNNSLIFVLCCFDE